MSTPDISNVFAVPGRLSHTPTSTATLQQAYPHGGTAIGAVGRVTPYPRDPAFPLRAVEWGNAVYDVVEGGHDWVITAELREVFDADALAAIFPCYAAGASGGPVLSVNAGTDAQRAGILLGTTFSRVVVFTPDSPDEHPMLILRRAHARPDLRPAWWERRAPLADHVVRDAGLEQEGARLRAPKGPRSMKLGPLSIISGALEVDEAAVADALVNTAANFLGAGGVVSLTEWAAMPPEERRALHRAARVLELEAARVLAREIIRGQINPAALLAEPAASVAAPPEPAGTVAP